MDPRIVSKPGFTVVGVKYLGKNENLEIPELWGDFGEQFSEFKHRSEEGISYRMMDNFDQVLGEFDYAAVVLTGSSVMTMPGDFTLKHGFDGRVNRHFLSGGLHR